MAARTEELERIQRWFHTAITRPAAMPDDLDEIVLPSQALNPTERLSIYADMYFDRLIDILADEFPTVRHLLGTQNFATVAKEYVLSYPSTHYSLALLGKKFPRFLREEISEVEYPQRNFAGAIAMVERTMEDVFDEQQDDPLLFEELQSIKPESWNQVRLKTISALRLLQLPYPVNDYISAVRDGRSTVIPDEDRSFIVIYRLDYRIWRKDLDEQQFTLLSELHAGSALGEALVACAELPGSEPETLVSSIYEWFRDWSAEGFFHKVDIRGQLD